MESRRAVSLAIIVLGCTPHELPADGTAPPEPPVPATITAAPPPVVAAGPGGCFAPARSYDVGFPPFQGDVADVDGDGALDLVIESIGQRDLAFVAGDGAGGFAVRRGIAVERGDRLGLALGDVDGDRKVDLLTFDPRKGDVHLRRGDGTGGFAASEPIALRKQVYGGVLHDLDGDGTLDLVTQHLRNLGIHRGRGDGRFATEVLLPVAQAPERVRVIDLDGDGALDLVSPSNDHGVLSRIHGRGAFEFRREQRATCGDGPHELAIADLDGDRRLDAAIATMHSDELCVFRQTSDGDFALAVRTPLLTEALDAADLDDDGTAELVLTDAATARLRVLALDASAGTLVERGASTTGRNPHALWLSDLDGDGRLDALMLDGDGAPEIWQGDVRSFEPHDTTVSVALGRACEP